LSDNAVVKYLVFDVESVADGELVRGVRHKDPREGDTDKEVNAYAHLSPKEAVNKYRRFLIERHGSDFIPYTFQMPISVVIAKVAVDYSLIDIVALDEPHFRPHVITDHFWRGWKAYHQPTFVTFNGRTFDLPLMELAAFRFGVSLGDWFNNNGPSYTQNRNRYNTSSHLDLHDVLTNFGATRFTGGLNLAAHVLGKPGKMGVEGHQVQDMYNDGEVERINAYCCHDVLDTYFVFLRTAVLTGDLTLDGEKNLVADAKVWVQKRAEIDESYQIYLSNWGDWQNPWESQPATATDAPVTDGPAPGDDTPADAAPADDAPAEPAVDAAGDVDTSGGAEAQ